MLSLNSLLPSLSKQPRRLGRGNSSSKGKTCGRGHKGQRARSGGNKYKLEGGQTPIHRRLPKHGFMRAMNKNVKAINLSILALKLKNGGMYSVKTLKNLLGIKNYCLLKLLDGNISIRNLFLSCELASAGAIYKISQLGGSISLLKSDACRY